MFKNNFTKTLKNLYLKSKFLVFHLKINTSFLLKNAKTKKNAQKFWSKDLVYKKPFGYRVIHQYSLTS